MQMYSRHPMNYYFNKIMQVHPIKKKIMQVHAEITHPWKVSCGKSKEPQETHVDVRILLAPHIDL